MAAGREIGLELILRRAENLVGSAAALTLALEDFGIDLPPVSTGAVDQAQLRAIATLYLASELEAAGVIPAVETLTGLARSGALPLNLSAAAPLVQAFWQKRNERATAEERLGFFSGLFGTVAGPDDADRPRNDEFEVLLIDLCEALYKLDELASNTRWGGVAQQARVRSAAQRLIVNLVRISSAITVFLAQEILAALRAALAILGHPAVMAAFRARTPWDVIAAIDRHAKAVPRQYELHLQRGQAGMTLLAWLADAAAVLDVDNKPIVGLDHPVIAAAIDWLEASLTLSEQAAPAATKPVGSPWAALAG